METKASVKRKIDVTASLEALVKNQYLIFPLSSVSEMYVHQRVSALNKRGYSLKATKLNAKQMSVRCLANPKKIKTTKIFTEE